MHVVPEFQTIVKEVGDEGKKGTSYIKPPYSVWSLEYGESDDLGMFNALAKEVISKKYALQFWDQFAEVFGMPLRIGKTSSQNKGDIVKIETMLEGMGSAAWGLFPEGTSLEIIESTRGDAFNVYDKRVSRANSEISKAVLGQTMTMDDGSSQSQATVHENVADNISESDTTDILAFCNEDLLPFLIMHGFPLTSDHQIAIDDSHQFTPKEMKDIEEMILKYYNVDEKHFIENYNVPITGKREQVNNQQQQQLGKGFFDDAS